MNRTPLRGYNHNVRYGGRLYHVQTEDSGVQSPRVHTHLFHDGTILSSKRGEYDPEAEVVAVQRLMQAQHKSMLRDLLDGLFDVKIAQFFGEPIAMQRSAEPLDGPASPPSDLPPIPPPDLMPDPVPARAAEPAPSPGRPRPLSAEDLRRALVELQLDLPKRAPASAPPLARPTLPQPTTRPRPDAPALRKPASPSSVDEGIARSLDEVILAYLAEDE